MENAWKKNNWENTQTWEDPYKRKNDAGRWFLVAIIGITAVLIVILASILLPSCEAFAGEIPEETAVHCILGEARGEGYASMLGHAEALRTRGSTRGVYGCNVNLNKEMPYLRATGILTQARQAWEASKTSKTVSGAQFWASKIVDGKWATRMRKAGFVLTATIGNTEFYKEVK